MKGQRLCEPTFWGPQKHQLHTGRKKDSGSQAVSVPVAAVSNWEEQSSGLGWWPQPHNCVNVLGATELPTSKQSNCKFYAT